MRRIGLRVIRAKNKEKIDVSSSKYEVTRMSGEYMGKNRNAQTT